ncbi:MAG: hexose kinase, partial [Anaerolineae bacterium]|nr:hexose kinase [Anaerolineae bacterium]
NGETRVNISIVTPKNAHYVKVNEAGPTIGTDEQAAMIAKVRQLARRDDWWVVSGSLPPGVPSDFYATLVRLIRAAGAKVALDTSGKALQLACVAQPHFIKPNRDELAELTGLPVAELAQVAAALRKAQAMTGGEVLVSLGKDGAMFCDAGERRVWLAHSPKIQEKNPIGAGDSMLAGVIWGLSEGQPLRTALAWGLACGAAAASLPGTGVGSRADVASLLDQVSFTRCHYL